MTTKRMLIIGLLAAIAIVLLIVGPVYVKRFNMQRQDRLTWRVILIGRSLAATTNSSDLVWISPSLKDTLARFLGSEVVDSNYFQYGDEPPPLGDGTATYRLYLTNKKGECLAIRLCPDSKSSQFRVLGFWMPDAAHIPREIAPEVLINAPPQ